MVKSRAATYLAVLLLAGSLGVFLVESLLCRWPAPHPLSPTAAVLTAVTYVSIAVLSGSVSTLLFWFPSGMTSSVSLRLFTFASAIGWIWVPSVVLLSRQRSIAAVPIAATAAVVMAGGLRKIMPSHTGTHNLLNGKSKPRELFAQYLDTCSSRDGRLHHCSRACTAVSSRCTGIRSAPPASYGLFARSC